MGTSNVSAGSNNRVIAVLCAEEDRIRVRLLSKQTLVVVVFSLLAYGFASADITADQAAKALPDKIDSFHALGPAQLPMVGIFEQVRPDEFGAISQASRSYSEAAGPSFIVYLIRTQTGSGAYSLLTHVAAGTEDIKLDVVGTASIASPNRVVFYKGENLVEIWGYRGAGASQEQLLRLARSFAASLPSTDDDLPAIVKHLPNWQTMQPRASYVLSLDGLKAVVPNQQGVLETISFDGDTEAVAAYYGHSQLVIVEFATPQLAGDSDRRIAPKIQELRNSGQPYPNGYRRVGNYSVFVFNAPDEKTANQLIDQVKYEKLVQWLGDNPHWYEKAIQAWARTAGGVFVTVLESAGLAFLGSLGIGSVIGALLFLRRRALHKEAMTYSDAGGMVRLNLDEIPGTTESTRLLTDGSGKR